MTSCVNVRSAVAKQNLELLVLVVIIQPEKYVAQDVVVEQIIVMIHRKQQRRGTGGLSDVDNH